MTDELDEIASLATPLTGAGDLDRLLDRIGDARYVLLGEASHGTSEYYRWRADLTKRLVEEKGFSFVAVEGDWPDCFAVNRWVKGHAHQDRSAREVLCAAFGRWPTWMWRNEEVADLATWLRDHNVRNGAAVGFYGLDVYSLWESLRRVLDYLGDKQPEAFEAAVRAARCFEPYFEDPQQYAWATRLVPSSCEREVVDLLLEIRTTVLPDDGPEAELDALQNAEVLAGAERYYRAMVQANGESWNVRDCHMADTLDRLMAHHGPGARCVVWEHNTHIGDARATDMALAGMVNVGQVVRERHAREGVVLVGFSGHRGTVVAGDAWGAPHRVMAVPPPPDGTHEDLIARVAPEPSLFVFGEGPNDGPWLSSRRGHRAIGVVYAPDRERRGNWVPTVMGARYDALLSFGETSALHPL